MRVGPAAACGDGSSVDSTGVLTSPATLFHWRGGAGGASCAGMSELAKLGEALIDEAIASGALRPPPPGAKVDLESYFSTPSEWRAGFAMLRGNHFVPPEVELLKQAEALEEELAGCADAASRIRLRNRISELRAQFAMALERMKAARGND